MFLQLCIFPQKTAKQEKKAKTQISLARSDQLELIRKEVYSWSNYTEVLFVTDYPGMVLENYIDSSDMSNVSLRVLEGEVNYSEEESLASGSEKWLKLNKGDVVRIETGRFHKVKTAGPHPAGYMYAFINRTKLHLDNAGSVGISTKLLSFIIIFVLLSFWKKICSSYCCKASIVLVLPKFQRTYCLFCRISDSSKARRGFPLFQELKDRVEAFAKAMTNVANAISILVFEEQILTKWL